MGLKEKFKAVRDGYVEKQAMNAELPAFPEDNLRRYRVRFIGRVQKVGFRHEVILLSRRLGLTGWCRNEEDGSVLAEFQGPECRIRWLIAFMESLKRIRIREKRMETLEVIHNETEFVQK